MMHNTTSLLFKALLIIALVMQPLLMPMAMADMHHPKQGKVPAKDMHATHSQHDMSAMSQQADGNIAMQDCCDNSVCCPAIALSLTVQTQSVPHTLNPPHEPLWFSISLAQEPRPPRA